MIYAQPLKWGAKYRCVKCKHEFVGYPGPNQGWKNLHEPSNPTQCPECGHIYLEWLNYGEYKLRSS